LSFLMFQGFGLKCNALWYSAWFILFKPTIATAQAWNSNVLTMKCFCHLFKKLCSCLQVKWLNFIFLFEVTTKLVLVYMFWIYVGIFLLMYSLIFLWHPSFLPRKIVYQWIYILLLFKFLLNFVFKLFIQI
jgi:hypothetical protein